MTRRDQTLRAWIERENARHNFQSCVSHKGKTHRLSTHTRIRKAAREFNTLHTLQVLTPKPKTAKQSPDHQHHLFSSSDHC